MIFFLPGLQRNMMLTSVYDINSDIQWEQDSDEEELLELPDSWTEKDEEPEEYWVTTKKGEVEFQGKTYIKCSVMYGGGSQLDPRDSIADTTPLSIIEAQKEIEEADITPDEDEDQPKPLDMTEEEVEAVSQIFIWRLFYIFLVEKTSTKRSYEKRTRRETS